MHEHEAPSGPPRRPASDPSPQGEWSDCELDQFVALLELDATARAVALAELAAADPGLHAAVVSLLLEHEQPPRILAKMLATTPDAIDTVVTTGTCIGPYLVLAPLGRGGMGIVYRAQQDRPKRTVALKVMASGVRDDGRAQRFEREVEVLGLLEHPGICRIYGAGTVDLGFGIGETMYFAMEFVPGPTLTEFAAAQQLDIAARCKLVARICDAVQHAHEHGVVHRDLKPGNVLVGEGPDGEPMPKVLDFGIARAIAIDTAPSFDTRTGMLLGTLPYMSPEQLNGSAQNLDARSDVYALGVILYELLAARLPLQFEGLSLVEVCRIAGQREPVPLGTVDHALRGDLATIVHKALQKDRDDRYSAAGELGADLRRFLRHEPILARRPTAMYRLRRFAQRNRALVWGTAVTMLALLLGLLGLGWLAAMNDALADRESTARQTTERANAALRASLYRSQMRLGSESMQAAGGVAHVRKLVEAWLPSAGETDLRGFEWHLLWASSHREQRVFAVEPTPQTLHWSRDGAVLVSSHWQTLIQWNVATGSAESRYSSQVEPLAAAAVDDTGRFGVQVVAPRVVQTIDLSTGVRGIRFEHADEVHRCELSGDGKLLACFTPHNGVILWDVRSGRQLATLPGQWAGGMTFSADNRWLALAIFDQGDGLLVRAWHTDDWSAPRRELHGPTNVVLNLAFAADGQRLAGASNEGHLLVWDFDTTKLTHDLSHEDGLRGVAFSPDGHRIAVGCRDYLVHVHDLATGAQHSLRGHTGIVSAVAWSPHGELLASLGDDATLRLWDPEQPEVPRSISLATEQTGDYGQLRWSPDSQRLAASLANQAAGTLDLSTGKLAPDYELTVGDRHFHAHPTTGRLALGATAARELPPFRFVEASPDGTQLAIAEGRKQFWAWDIQAGTLVTHPFPIEIRGLAWLGADRLVIADGFDRLSILDSRTGTVQRVRPVPECTLGIAANIAGDLVAIGCVDQAVRLWSPTTDTMVELRGHTSHVQAVAFAPDGKRLASGSRDRTVRIWDVAAAAEVMALRVAGQVVALAWSPDGTRLGALLAHGEIVVWDARPIVPH